MLYAVDIERELSTLSNKDILDIAIQNNDGWENNYLIDSNRNSDMYTPIYCASKYSNYQDEFEKFYYFVIKPYATYAINYTLIKLGYRLNIDVINEY